MLDPYSYNVTMTENLAAENERMNDVAKIKVVIFENRCLSDYFKKKVFSKKTKKTLLTQIPIA